MMKQQQLFVIPKPEFMRKYSFGLLAITLAILLSSFLKPKSHQKLTNDIFLVYYGGNQSSLSNYVQVTTFPPGSCVGSRRLCWFRAIDLNYDGYIDSMEFFYSFSLLDTDADFILDDQTETYGTLEKGF
jgi:hypothetical protein